MKTRKAPCRDMFNEPARHERSRRIREQITGRGSREPERPRHTKRLKNRKACHALKQVENARQHSALRTKKGGDEQYPECLASYRNRSERQRDYDVSAKHKQDICGSDPESIKRNAFAAKDPICDQFRGA